MRNLFFYLSTIFFFTLFQSYTLPAFEDYLQNKPKTLAMADDIGNIISKESKNTKSTKIAEKVASIISKKYRLQKPESHLIKAMGEMVNLRRKYQFSMEGNSMSARAYDALLAEALLALQNTPTDAPSGECQRWRGELVRLLQQYDSRLKEYQKCLNGKGISAQLQIETFDMNIGYEQDQASGGSSNCQGKLDAIKDITDKIKRIANIVNMACRGQS